MRGHTGQHSPGGTKLSSQGGAAQSCTAQIRLPLSHSLRKIEKSGESGPGACSQNCYTTISTYQKVHGSGW